MQKQIKLAYLIIAHKNVNQLKRLFAAIYHPNNYYLIHVDQKSDIDCHNVVKEITSKYSNVYSMKSRKVRWGGFSIVRVELDGIKKMLTIGNDWSFFINLSGQDFPLKSQEEIKSYLEVKTNCNFIEIFDPLQRRFWTDPLSGEKEAVSRIRNIYLEIPFKSSVFCLSHRLKIYRRQFIDGVAWYGGPQWFILNRSFCEYTMNSKKIKKFVGFFKYTSVPDESFFQTVIMASKYSNSVINDNKREINWKKGANRLKTYTIDDLHDLLKSEKFFARKFDESIDSKILDELEKKLGLIRISEKFCTKSDTH